MDTQTPDSFTALQVHSCTVALQCNMVDGRVRFGVTSGDTTSIACRNLLELLNTVSVHLHFGLKNFRVEPSGVQYEGNGSLLYVICCCCVLCCCALCCCVLMYSSVLCYLYSWPVQWEWLIATCHVMCSCVLCCVLCVVCCVLCFTVLLCCCVL